MNDILKTAARYVLIGVANLLDLIARGSTWLANQARELEAKL